MQRITIHVLAVFVTLTIASECSAQSNPKTIGNFYYLDFPRSDIFNTAFSKPNGKTDPFPIATNSDEITDEDIKVSNGSAEQKRNINRSSSNTYLFGTWSGKKGLFYLTEYFKVKHSQLKSDSWSKYKDQAFHVSEALSGDSVIIKIYKNRNDTTGAAALQKIANLFVGQKTFIGKVLDAMGNSDSTSKSQTTEVVRLRSGSIDTLTMLIKDASVFFAVRFVQVGDANFITRGRKVEAPDCAQQIKKNPDSVFTFRLGPKQTTFNLIGSNCNIEGYKVKATFEQNEPGGGTLYFIKEDPNSVSNNSGRKIQRSDTLYISQPIDFNNEYYNQNYNNTVFFVSKQVASKNGAQNTLVTCRVVFKYDPESRTVKVVNYSYLDYHYQTCLYRMTANLTFYPK